MKDLAATPWNATEARAEAEFCDADARQKLHEGARKWRRETAATLRAYAGMLDALGVENAYQAEEKIAAMKRERVTEGSAQNLARRFRCDGLNTIGVDEIKRTILAARG